MLETGKIDSELLKSLVFNKIKFRNDDVKVRPGIGEDCAVVDFGEYDCVMSTDPITAAVCDIGRLAIHITCNDIASNGIQPLGIMLVVMLPEGTTEKDIEYIMEQSAETARELKVEIIGGHTEITPAVRQPVIVSTAIGKAVSGLSQSGNDMAPGDWIMMTKYVGLEGTGIIASDCTDQLRECVSDDEIEQAKRFLNMVSVVQEGITAGRVGTHGMHDVTEGGILGAVWEMCQIAGVGADIFGDEIPVMDVTRKICDFFNIDYMRLISSGSMVIIVPDEKKECMQDEMKKAGIKSAIIGRVVKKENGVTIIQNKIKKIVEPPGTDELYKAIKK